MAQPARIAPTAPTGFKRFDGVDDPFAQRAAGDLLPVIAQDAVTRDVLMLAWQNGEAFQKTLESGEMHYWSRSRNEMWHKGSTSGAFQLVHSVAIDCDRDTILYQVRQKGLGACHRGTSTCFSEGTWCEAAAEDDVVLLARPSIVRLQPYQSARVDGDQEASIYLDANENPYPPFPGTAEETSLNRYPEPQPRKLLEGFQRLLDIPQERLFVSRGADEAIALLVQVFCEPRRDGVVICPPTFAMYGQAAAQQDVRVHAVPLDPSRGFALDEAAILHRVQAERTPLVFVCSPNNPTGNAFFPGQLRDLAWALRGRALLVVDEIYAEFSSVPSVLALRELPDNLVVLRSLSKAYGFAGERVGVTVASEPVVALLHKVMAPYSLSVSAIQRAIPLLSPEGISYAQRKQGEIVKGREELRSAFREIPLIREVFPSEANFLLVRVDEPNWLVGELRNRGIRIRNTDHLVPKTVRISVGSPQEIVDLLRALYDLVMKQTVSSK